jgi:hypothetical protein
VHLYLIARCTWRSLRQRPCAVQCFDSDAVRILFRYGWYDQFGFSKWFCWHEPDQDSIVHVVRRASRGSAGLKIALSLVSVLRQNLLKNCCAAIHDESEVHYRIWACQCELMQCAIAKFWNQVALNRLACAIMIAQPITHGQWVNQSRRNALKYYYHSGWIYKIEI